MKRGIEKGGEKLNGGGYCRNVGRENEGRGDRPNGKYNQNKARRMIGKSEK